MATMDSNQENVGYILIKEIIVSTQVELDSLPEKFDEYTRILIKNTTSKLVVNKAWGNSSVEAEGNSSVVAWGNSSVEAWGNSSVEAEGNCVVRIFSENLKKMVLFGFAVAFIPINLTVNVEKKSEYCYIQVVKNLGWFENNAVEKTSTVTLYKKISKDFKTQENRKNETLWLVGSTVNHPAWNPDNGECGEGKFHACSRPYFCDEFRNKKGDRYIAVSIKLEDLYEWKDSPSYPHKIAFRACKVLYECDRFGKELK